MNPSLSIREPLGERAALLPLDIGSEASGLPLPGAGDSVVMLSAAGRQWLALPAPGARALLNGMPLRGSQPLADGDVLAIGDAQVTVHPQAARIDVWHLAGNATVAPLRDDVLPGDEVIAGVREIMASDAPLQRESAAAAPRRRRARGVLYGALAMLLLGAIGVLFALVPVPLQLAPEGASVDVPGLIDWQSESRVFLLPGQRTLSVSHPGYRSRTIRLNVSRTLAGAAPLAVSLDYLPGVIEVDSGGVEGELLVDGRPAGKVPGAVEVEAGPRVLIVRAPRHVDHVANISVNGGGQRQQVTVQLQSSIGHVAIDTAPAGAVIQVDGRDAGVAPQRVELDAGLHSLELRAPGRRPWRSDIAVIAGQTLDLGRIDLALPPATALRAATQVQGTSEASVRLSTDTAGSVNASDVVPAAARAPLPARAQSALLGALVLLPAGEYRQGSERREQGRRSNEVLRTVRLTRAFYMAATEVSNAQFRQFRPGHQAGIALEKSLDLDTQAVSNVTWNDAVEFCNWLSLREDLPAAYERRDGRWQLVQPVNRGYRLPTEAEWEYAIRYVDGQRWQRYAWGDALPPPAGAANLGGAELQPETPSRVAAIASLPQYRDDHVVIGPAGTYSRTAIGLADLGGNVSEWMHDVYESLPAGPSVTDPFGPATDGPHAIRGANWRSANLAELRAAWRERATGPSVTLGFRVVRYAEDPPT